MAVQFEMMVDAPGGKVKIVADTVKELIENAAFFQELPLVTPDGHPTWFGYRDINNNVYYSVRGFTGGKFSEVGLGQNRDGGGLFLKHRDGWMHYNSGDNTTAQSGPYNYTNARHYFNNGNGGARYVAQRQQPAVNGNGSTPNGAAQRPADANSVSAVTPNPEPAAPAVEPPDWMEESDDSDPIEPVEPNGNELPAGESAVTANIPAGTPPASDIPSGWIKAIDSLGMALYTDWTANQGARTELFGKVKRGATNISQLNKAQVKDAGARLVSAMQSRAIELKMQMGMNNETFAAICKEYDAKEMGEMQPGTLLKFFKRMKQLHTEAGVAA